MSLYRKYRPATFAEVVGQDQVTKPLSAALDSGRINHAYLFSGPRGCGKTSSARILARSLNCVNGPTSTPCGECESCRALAPGGPGNLDVTELDAASQGSVEDMRELRERAMFAPAESRYRVYIIDECHMISGAGANALLKVVEEPPEHLIFIFATTEPEKVIGTIRSRTHNYPFRLLTPQAMRGLLQQVTAAEGVTVEDAVYPLVIQAGGGSPRDSLSIMDQLIGGSGDGHVTYEKVQPLLGLTDFTLLDATVEALAAGDGARLFSTVDDVIESGIEPRRFVVDLLDRMRDLMVIQTVPEAFDMGLVEAPAGRAEVLSAQAGMFSPTGIAELADQINERMPEMKGATSPRLLLEILLAHLMITAQAAGTGHGVAAAGGGAGAGAAAGPASGGATAGAGQPGGHNPGYAPHEATGGSTSQAPVRGSRGSQAAREAIARAQAARSQDRSERPERPEVPQRRVPSQQPAQPQEQQAQSQAQPQAPAQEQGQQAQPMPLQEQQAPAPEAAPAAESQVRPAESQESAAAPEPAPQARPAAEQAAQSPQPQGAAEPAPQSQAETAADSAPETPEAPEPQDAAPAAPSAPEAQAEPAAPAAAKPAVQNDDELPGEDASDEELTEAVRRRWGQVRHDVGKRNHIAQIMLTEATVLGVREGTVYLGHNTGALASRVNAESNNKDIAAAFTEEFGRPLAVQCQVGTDPVAAGFSAPATPQPAWQPQTTAREHQAPSSDSTHEDDSAEGGEPGVNPAAERQEQQPAQEQSARVQQAEQEQHPEQAEQSEPAEPAESEEPAASAESAGSTPGRTPEPAAEQQLAVEPEHSQEQPASRAEQPAQNQPQAPQQPAQNRPQQTQRQPQQTQPVAPVWGEPAALGGSDETPGGHVGGAAAAGARGPNASAQPADQAGRQGQPGQPGPTAQPTPPANAPQNGPTPQNTAAPTAPRADATPGTRSVPGPAPTPNGTPTAGAGTSASGGDDTEARVISLRGGRKLRVPHAGNGRGRPAQGRRFGGGGGLRDVPPPPEPMDDDVPPPPDPMDYGGPGGPAGTPPAPYDQRAEEEDMMREASLQPGNLDRRDAMTLAMELLSKELGAKPM